MIEKIVSYFIKIKSYFYKKNVSEFDFTKELIDPYTYDWFTKEERIKQYLEEKEFMNKLVKGKVRINLNHLSPEELSERIF